MMRRILGILLGSVLSVPAALAQEAGPPPTEGDGLALETFSGHVLASGLEGPWEITWGPDDMLWVTERAAGRVVRIDPGTGARTELLTLEDVLADQQHQGLLGMALHPGLLDGGDSSHVYLYHTYDSTPGDGDDQDAPRARIVRAAYDPAAGTLGEPVELIAGIPAGNDHNGGRLKIGPDGMLYATLGEQGANQFGNWCKPIEAQRLPTAEEVEQEDWSAYKGKTLRMTLDGAIPEDNPEIEGVRSHVFTWGHRNPQGIVFGPDGTLYQSEHGANADDEINILEGGVNFGWPHVAGFRDDQAYVYANWSAAPNCADLAWTNLMDEESLPDEVPFEAETDWDGDFAEPLKTLFTVPNGFDFEDEACDGMFFICRPSVAPSSIDFYPGDGPIPGWGPSLLVTTLKNGAVYRLLLTEDGQGVRDIDRLFGTVNRYRDLAIAPDGRTIYVATDMGGMVRGPDAGATDQLANPGSILVFTHQGQGPAD